MKNNSKNIFDIVIYILFFIFVCIVFYSFIKLIYFKLSTQPRNSTNVSSINEIKIENTSDFLYEVTYYDITPASNLNDISSASIIYEYLSPESNPIYKGIFENTPNCINSNIYKSATISKSQLPISCFSKSYKDLIGLTNDANFIFSKLFYNHSSNFIYKDGKYTHYLTNKPQLDCLKNKELSVSNVIIQLVNEASPSNYSLGDGYGYLCSQGKVQKIGWKKDSHATRLFYENGSEIPSITGTTWWIISNTDGEFLFN